jgi:chromosome segregation ATPase
MRGCCYALALLAIAASVKHAWQVEDHLFQLGVEGSLACAYFITALAFEQGSSFIESLRSQVETRKAALENLEEELAKTQESSLSQQIIYQEKIASLQKELEELQTEHSSILILNEVLRKTTARHVQEHETVQSANVDLHRQIELLKSKLRECEEEINRLSTTEAVVIQNKELMQELNAARYEKEQTHLINETLARLHIRETLKAKEAEQEADSLAEQLVAAHREVKRVGEPLLEARREISTLKTQFEKAEQSANQAREAVLKMNEIQMERNFLRERLQAAQEELVLTQQKDPVHKQLKKQFDEKNQVLHQVRAELFKTDTELQKLRIEKAALELQPLPKEVERELEALTSQITSLEEENRELQELITVLSQNEKKK